MRKIIVVLLCCLCCFPSLFPKEKTVPKEKQRSEKKSRKKSDAELIDLDVKIKGEFTYERTFSTHRFTLPEGKLLCYYNSDLPVRGKSIRASMNQRAKLRQARIKAGIRFLKMGYIEYGGNEDIFYVQDFEDPESNLAKGYKIIHGEEAYTKALEETAKGTPPWICSSEYSLYVDAEFYSKEAPLTKKQINSYLALITEEKEVLKKVYSLYEKCKKEKAEEDIKALFDAVEKLYRPELSVSNLVEGDFYSKEQKRFKEKQDWLHATYNSSANSGKNPYNFKWDKGTFRMVWVIKPQEAGSALSFLKQRLSIVKQDIQCTLDPKLEKRIIKGKIQFKSVDEGLKLLAHLVRGKLVKNEDGTYRITEK